MQTDSPPHSARLLVGIILVLSCVVAYQFGAKRDHSRAQVEDAREQVIEGLRIDPAHLDFGQAWEEKNFVWKLPIQNKTSQDIKIQDFALSCGCLDIEPKSLTIPANEVREIGLSVDLTKQRWLPNLGDSERSFAVEITPIQNARAWPRIGWKLHGTVRSRITLDKLAMNFGDEPVKEESPVKLKALAIVHIAAKAVAPEFDSKIVKVALKPREDHPNHFDVEVSPQPTLPVGEFETQVRLDIIAPSGERFPGTVLPVTGNMQPEIRVLPTRLLLGSVPVGKTAVGEVALQAPTNEELIVEDIAIDSRTVSIEPVTVDGLRKGRTFQIKQRVTKEGDQSSLVTFRIRRGTGTRVTASMEASYRGQSSATAEPTKNLRNDP
jgi:hypothetical protein